MRIWFPTGILPPFELCVPRVRCTVLHAVCCMHAVGFCGLASRGTHACMHACATCVASLEQVTCWPLLRTSMPAAYAAVAGGAGRWLTLALAFWCFTLRVQNLDGAALPTCGSCMHRPVPAMMLTA